MARPGAPGLSASVASLSHTARTYADADGRQGGVILALFGNWLCLAVVCEVKSAVGALGYRGRVAGMSPMLKYCGGIVRKGPHPPSEFY